MSQSEEPVIIKRYESRKLYDADAKVYVTLEDIARYIRDGREVKILDKKTGEDLTRQYLIQIIAEFESKGEDALPLNVLTDLVRHYQDQAKSMTPAFLSQVFEAFKEQQQEVIGKMQGMRGQVFDPSKALDTMRAWQERQADFFGRAMNGWIKAPEEDSSNPTDNAGSKTDKASDTSPKNAGSDNGADRIAEIEAKLAELQSQLGKLK